MNSSVDRLHWLMGSIATGRNIKKIGSNPYLNVLRLLPAHPPSTQRKYLYGQPSCFKNQIRHFLGKQSLQELILRVSRVVSGTRLCSEYTVCQCLAGERPYRCTVESCSKAFRQLSSLQQHLKGHNIVNMKSYPISRNSSAPLLESSTVNKVIIIL